MPVRPTKVIPPLGKSDGVKYDLRPRAIEDQVTSLGGSAWDSVDRTATILFGDSRTGKTTLWATWPGPILALICDDNDLPGELKSINKPEYRRKIRAEAIKKSETVFELLKNVSGYQTVVFDHLTALQSLTLAEVLGLERLPVQKSFGMATLEQHGASTSRCKEIVKTLLNLNCNVVVVCQEEIITPKDNQVSEGVMSTRVVPAVSKGLSKFIKPAFDYRLQTFTQPEIITEKTEVEGVEVVNQRRTGKIQYCLRVGPHEVYDTGFRTPYPERLPDLIVSPTYDKLLPLTKDE